MKCPKCGSWMRIIKRVDTGNFIIRRQVCNGCKCKKITYEFFGEDIPKKFIQKGTRVLIGDNHKDMVPGVYLTCNNSLYPHLVLDDDGELQGKLVIELAWEVDGL